VPNLERIADLKPDHFADLLIEMPLVPARPTSPTSPAIHIAIMPDCPLAPCRIGLILVGLWIEPAGGDEGCEQRGRGRGVGGGAAAAVMMVYEEKRE
jgi:hypothetical protein